MDRKEERAARKELEAQEREAARKRGSNALLIFGIFVMLPAIVRWQVEPRDLSPWILTAAACFGGALAGFVWRKEARLPGLVGGAVAGFCAMFGADLYLTQRERIFVAELVLPIAIGCLPGVLVYFALSRLTKGP